MELLNPEIIYPQPDMEKILSKLTAEERKIIEDLIYFDPLTSLNNRRGYESRFKYLISMFKRYGHPFSLLNLDIDDFKVVNDNYGHVAGDKVLAKLGSVIREQIRETDHASRLGGGADEFRVLSDTDVEGAKMLGERIREAVEQMRITRRNIAITVSIGVSPFIESDTQEICEARSDEGLYRCKMNGKNIVSL
jgi:diguanylate cyclase (GGDEF)-like protein